MNKTSLAILISSIATLCVSGVGLAYQIIDHQKQPIQTIQIETKRDANFIPKVQINDPDAPKPIEPPVQSAKVQPVSPVDPNENSSSESTDSTKSTNESTDSNGYTEVKRNSDNSL